MPRLRPAVSLLVVAAFGVAGPAGAQAADDDAEPINLLCSGQGERLESHVVSGLEWDRYDHRYRSRSGTETAMRGFDTVVTVQIQGDDGRIRLPSRLVPAISAGGDHQHWWQLDDLVVGRNEIRGSYRLNGINKPKLRIDRTTGEITIKEFGQDFSGSCEKVDPGARRF